MRNVKILVGLALLISLALLWQGVPRTAAQSKNLPSLTSQIQLPESALIDRFDAAIQQRFLTAPSFGISRLAGQVMTPHLGEQMRESAMEDGFISLTTEESASIQDLHKEGWKAGLYLYGRRTTEKISVKNKQEYKEPVISYRLNRALPITPELKRKQMAEPQKLLKEVTTAFDSFTSQNSYEFEKGKWSYVARPIRARESCLECHTDFALTEKIGENNYKYRPRKTGDTIGVVVYAFAKTKKQLISTK